MAIEEQTIIDGVSELSLEGDENGIISVFGVYLTRMFSDYYCEISYKFEDKFKEIAPKEVQHAARQLLIESGHVCGFNTFGGIMKSDEWKSLILPMIESREDWIYGMVAVINTLGWGKFKINELHGKNKLIIDIANSYESTYYLAHYGATASNGKCYLAIGATIALMNLLYNGDITKEPELDDDLYNMLFKENPKYSGTEISCRSKGDPVCRIEINYIE